MPKVLLILCLLMMTSAAAADSEFTLTLKDHHFVPDTLEVPANGDFKLLVKNEDASSEEFESISLKKEKIIPPGKTASLLVKSLKPGTYTFFGDFHPDTAQGNVIAK